MKPETPIFNHPSSKMKDDLLDLIDDDELNSIENELDEEEEELSNFQPNLSKRNYEEMIESNNHSDNNVMDTLKMMGDDVNEEKEDLINWLQDNYDLILSNQIISHRTLFEQNADENLLSSVILIENDLKSKTSKNKIFTHKFDIDDSIGILSIFLIFRTISGKIKGYFCI